MSQIQGIHAILAGDYPDPSIVSLYPWQTDAERLDDCQIEDNRVVLKAVSNNRTEPLLCIPMHHAYTAEVSIEVEGDGEGTLGLFFRDWRGQWSKQDHGFEMSGFHHNVLGGFLSLRIALDATGDGIVKFSNFVCKAFETRLKT